VASLSLTLAARVLPTLVLAMAGWAMVTSGSGNAHTSAGAGASPSSHASPGPSGSSGSGGSGGSGASPGPSGKSSAAPTGRVFPSAPAPCGTLPKSTITSLVPGAKTTGSALKTSDASRHTDCAWHALKGYDYRWLDVSYEIVPSTTGGAGNGVALRSAEATYQQQKQATPVPGLGDEASLGGSLSTQDKQQTREAVVVVREGNAVVTITYNGSDFKTGKAPGATTVGKGALTAAKAALNGLTAATVAST
jgi:hypothetical protein